MPAPRLLLHTDHYTEGVVVASDGTIYFSMTSVGTISCFKPGAEAATVWAHVPAANGHAIDSDGTHIAMASVGAIVRLDASGRATHIVASKVDERWLTYPNDLALDVHRGGFFITDSGYKVTPKTLPEDPQGRVYRVDSNGRIRQVAGGIAYSNGIALSPDGTRLYIGESVARRLWAFAVLDDGSLGARTLLAETPTKPGETAVPDGITVGPDARLYVANHGGREVLVYEPDGTLVARLDAGNKGTSHVAFSRDGRTLYVSGSIEEETGAGAIFEIAM